MSRLTDIIKDWPEERLNEFLRRRKDLLISGPGNLCNVSKDPGEYRWAPFTFDSTQYIHAPLLTNYPYGEPFGQIINQNPASLIDPNPFASSRFRKEGVEGGKAYACWDAALCIPALVTRNGGRVLPYTSTPVLRNTNKHWTDRVRLAMSRVGPMGAKGKLMRPEGRWIYDMTKTDYGWQLMEMAHVLTHMRNNHLVTAARRKFSYHRAILSGVFQSELTKIVTALAFGLPIDIESRCVESEIGVPDFPWCGLDVKSSSYVTDPILRVPVGSNEAPCIDRSLVMLDTGVFIEPHPEAFNAGHDVTTRHDLWSCMPSMVILAGWETVDYITHLPLCGGHGEDNKAPVSYAMCPADLMSPDDFGAILALAVKEYGMPQAGGKYMFVEDWFASNAYFERWLKTPPLPCPLCQCINVRAEGAPERPRKPRPDTENTRDPLYRMWQRWDANCKRILQLCAIEVISYENKTYGYKEGPRLRKMRKELGAKTLKQEVDAFEATAEASKYSDLHVSV